MQDLQEKIIGTINVVLLTAFAAFGIWVAGVGYFHVITG